MRREFRVRHLHGENAGEALARVVAGEADLLLFRDAAVVAAIALWNVVREAEDVLVVAVVPPHRDFNGDAVALGVDRNRLFDQCRLGAVQKTDKGFEAALIHEVDFFGVDAALIGEIDPDARIQKSEFAQTMFERREIEIRLREGFGRRVEGDLGAGNGLCVRTQGRVADNGERRVGNAVPEPDDMFLARAPDAKLQPIGKRIDDGDADAVEAARHLVGVLVEFAAGMELRHDDFGGRYTLALVDFDRNAATIVHDSDGAVGIETHIHGVAMAREGLIDGVIDNLIDHVMKARTVIGVADIHAWALSHGIEALQNLDCIGTIFFRNFIDGRGHVFLSWMGRDLNRPVRRSRRPSG